MASKTKKVSPRKRTGSVFDRLNIPVEDQSLRLRTFSQDNPLFDGIELQTANISELLDALQVWYHENRQHHRCLVLHLILAAWRHAELLSARLYDFTVETPPADGELFCAVDELTNYPHVIASLCSFAADEYEAQTRMEHPPSPENNVSVVLHHVFLMCGEIEHALNYMAERFKGEADHA